MSLIPKITAAGKAAALAAYALNQSITITHMSLGAVAYTITGQETELQDLREVSSKIDGAQNADGTATITGLFFASDFSGAVYVVKEVGFHIGDPNDGGVLFAVYSRPNWVCAYRGGSIEADFAPSFTLEFDDVPDGSVTITSDPSAGFDAAVMREHLGDTDPHEQYVRHDANQGLTAAKQAQARVNIAAEKDGDALKRDGALAMLAPLVLSGNAGSPLHAVPLQQLQAYVTAQIDALPGDKFLAGLSGYDATTNTLSLLMSDGSTVSVDLTTLVGDAVATHEGKAVAHTPQQCGAEPAGAVAQHVEDYAHISMAAIQSAIDSAIAATLRACRPPGFVFPHYGTSPPDGALELAGQLVLRTAYPDLWTHASNNGFVVDDAVWLDGSGKHTLFSSGNGTTTFRLPRLGGEYLSFADRGANVESGRTVGSWRDKSPLTIPSTGWGTQNHSPAASDEAGALVVCSGNGEITEVLESLRVAATDGLSVNANMHPRGVALLACVWY